MMLQLKKGGLIEATAALLFGSATVAVVARSAWSEIEFAGRIAIVGLVLLAIGLIIGSVWLVAASSVPVLGAALSVSAAASEPAWAQSIMIGCLWYVTIELAWDAIELRIDESHDVSVSRVRIHQVATVVAISLGLGTLGVVASTAAPDRDLVALAPVVIGVVMALAFAIRYLNHTGSK